MSRLESIKSLIEQSPGDSRIRFMLCMEYMSMKDYAGAQHEFDELISRDANYVAAYYQAGRCAEELGNIDAARAYYTRGIAAARATGDGHALSELQAALDLVS